MKDYHQLTQELRYQIEILKKAGKNQKDIADLVNVSPSTRCRELRRNTGKRGYRRKQAQAKAENRSKQTAKPLKMTPEAIALIDSKIVIDWSPEQISGWLEEGKGLFSAMSGSISTSGPTSWLAARCTSTFGIAARSASNTVPRTSAGRSGTVSVLMIGL